MDVGLAQWQFLLALLTGALLLFVAMWVAWRRVAQRREAERRIAAARVRSGTTPAVWQLRTLAAFEDRGFSLEEALFRSRQRRILPAPQRRRHRHHIALSQQPVWLERLHDMCILYVLSSTNRRRRKAWPADAVHAGLR